MTKPTPGPAALRTKAIRLTRKAAAQAEALAKQLHATADALANPQAEQPTHLYKTLTATIKAYEAAIDAQIAARFDNNPIKLSKLSAARRRSV